MNSISIIVVDDHTLVREGICSLLDKIENVEILAEANNGREALKLIEKYHPKIVLLDIAMPEMNGLEVVYQISKDHPEISVIILSMHANEEYVIQALKNGASGYLLKDAAKSELEIAINAVMKGEIYLAPYISRNLVGDYLSLVKDNHDFKNHIKYPSELLSPRKREILQLIAEGNSTKEIAFKLNLSTKTIEAHRKQIMEILNIFDIAGLVRFAIKTGITTLDK